MPLYVCYHGGFNSLALQHDPQFEVILAKDSLGRDWHCVAIRPGQKSDFTSFMDEIIATRHRANEQGMHFEATQIRTFECADAQELCRQLISQTKSELEIASKDTEHQNVSAPTFAPQTVPLRFDDVGVIRVGDCRVSLDSVIAEFKHGLTPEEIVSAYETLRLADVYGAITYYLGHKEEMEAYLMRRRLEADKLRQEIEAKQESRSSFREKLLARQAAMEKAQHASPTD